MKLDWIRLHWIRCYQMFSDAFRCPHVAPGCSWLLAATSWRRGTLGHARPHRSQRQICYDLPRPAKQNKNRSVEPIESDAMRIMKNHATHKQNIDKCKKTNAEDPKLSGSVEARHRTMSRNCSQTKKCYD